MSPKQKALFVQLQIAFAGVLIGTFGLLWKEWLLLLFGSMVFLYGMIRFFLIKKIMDSNPDVTEAEAAKALDLYAADRKKKDRKFYDPDYDPFYGDDYEDEDDFFPLPFVKAQAAKQKKNEGKETVRKVSQETEDSIDSQKPDESRPQPEPAREISPSGEPSAQDSASQTES